VILSIFKLPKVSDTESRNFRLLKELTLLPRYLTELSGPHSMVEPTFSSKVSS